VDPAKQDAKRAIRGGITAIAILPFGAVAAAWIASSSPLLPFAVLGCIAFVGAFGVSRILVGRDQLRALRQKSVPPPAAPLPTARLL